MGDLLVLFIVVTLLAGAVFKMVSDRKKGIQCPGCPHSKTCPSQGACKEHAPRDASEDQR